MKRLIRGAALTCAFAAGFAVHGLLPVETVAQAQSTRVFELRTYTTAEGKLQGLSDRFRDHTMALFRKHNMESIGYFIPQDDPQKQNTLVYLIAHKDRRVEEELGRVPGGSGMAQGPVRERGQRPPDCRHDDALP